MAGLEEFFDDMLAGFAGSSGDNDPGAHAVMTRSLLIGLFRSDCWCVQSMLRVAIANDAQPMDPPLHAPRSFPRVDCRAGVIVEPSFIGKDVSAANNAVKFVMDELFAGIQSRN